MNQTTPPTNAIAAFLAMLAAERGAAKNTLDAYRRDLEDAADFFNPPASLDTATTDALRLYLDHLAKTGMKASSAQRKTSALRQYFRFVAGGDVSQRIVVSHDVPSNWKHASQYLLIGWNPFRAIL